MDRKGRIFFSIMLAVASTYFVVSLCFLLLMLNAGSAITTAAKGLLFLNLFASASICGYCVFRLVRR